MLELKGVSRVFGGLRAVNKVDMTVEAGQIMGLIGPNGAGKTTLINCMSGLDHPTEGQIHFLGHPIHHQPAHVITNLGMARTYQNIRLFAEMSVLDNVIVAQHSRGHATLFDSLLFLPRYFRERRSHADYALSLLDRFNLRHAQHTLAGNLPYGDQRRLEMARSIATQPKLILLDEPTAGMNPTETRQFGEQILRVRDEGITLLVIEHDMSLIAQVCDAVYVLNFGEILAYGTPAEVKDDSAVIEAYLGEDDSLPQRE